MSIVNIFRNRNANRSKEVELSELLGQDSQPGLQHPDTVISTPSRPPAQVRVKAAPSVSGTPGSSSRSRSVPRDSRSSSLKRW